MKTKNKAKPKRLGAVAQGGKTGRSAGAIPRPAMNPAGGYADADYVPRRRGELYCAPFCGNNCTRAAFEAARAKAKALAKKLGLGWRPRVWENMGWHWSVVFAHAKLAISPSPVGWLAICAGSWTANGPTPRAVINDIRAQVSVAAARLKKLDHALDDA